MLITILLSVLFVAVLIGGQAYVHHKWPPKDSGGLPPGLF